MTKRTSDQKELPEVTASGDAKLSNSDNASLPNTSAVEGAPSSQDCAGDNKLSHEPAQLVNGDVKLQDPLPEVTVTEGR